MSFKRDDYDFPNCMHVLSACLHMHGIDPFNVTISLPETKWRELVCILERKFRNLIIFDERGKMIDEFRYMGFKFVPERRDG